VNDAELDRKLKTGREEARRFFDGQVDVRKNEEAIIGRERRLSARPRAWVRTCLAGAGVVAAAAVCAALILGSQSAGQTAQPTASALAEQTVYLSEDKAYRMNYIPVEMPDDGGGLMTVLWEMGGGDERMAYYSLFETGDTLYPALTIPFPGSDYDMLLIASGDSEMDSLGYRLIGYSGDALKTWWSQDSVPGGLVTLNDGVAVEQRADGSEATVTYIVPIQSPVPGAIALPVDTLRMSVGERLLLIGGGEETLDAASQSGLLGAEAQEENGVPAVLLKALRAGKDVVNVGPKENAKTLSVDIGE
jgi:hypothetical protein